MKKLFLGIGVGILSTLAISNFIPLKLNSESLILAASDSSKYIQADYSIRKILVNGVDTGAADSAFISSDVTYVPLRILSEILNNTVEWDQSTKTINITSTPTTNITSIPSNINGESFIGFETAKQIAFAKVGGGTIVSYGEELHGAYPKYHFVIHNNYVVYEIQVNAKTGDISNVSSHFNEEYKYNQILNESSFTITADEAIAIALERVGGGQVVKCERDIDDHIPEYKLEIVKDYLKYEIKINGKTGAIIKFEVD